MSQLEELEAAVAASQSDAKAAQARVANDLGALSSQVSDLRAQITALQDQIASGNTTVDLTPALQAVDALHATINQIDPAPVVEVPAEPVPVPEPPVEPAPVDSPPSE